MPPNEYLPRSILVSHRVHPTKMVHDALPTFHHENCITGANLRCCSCGPADETVDHVMQCASPPCEQFHDEQRSHPLLQQIFREAMYQWFAAEVSSITAVSPVLFPTDEHRLLRQKNEIGWRQIFKGRFSTNERQWIQNEYHYYQHWKKTKYKRTGI